MQINLDFNGFLFLVITIIIVLVGIYIINVLRSLNETVKTFNKVLERSEVELEQTIKNVEKITKEAGAISAHVTTLASKAEAAGKVAGNVISSLVKKEN